MPLSLCRCCLVPSTGNNIPNLDWRLKRFKRITLKQTRAYAFIHTRTILRLCSFQLGCSEVARLLELHLGEAQPTINSSSLVVCRWQRARTRLSYADGKNRAASSFRCSRCRLGRLAKRGIFRYIYASAPHVYLQFAF